MTASDGWFKSSYTNTECVEVKVVPSGVLVRDSKDAAGPVLSFTEGEWRAFVAGAKEGEFG